MLQNNRLAGLLRLDIGTLVLITLFPFVSLGFYAAMRRSRQAYAMLALFLILIGAVLGLANESAFSLVHLSDLHAEAETVAQQEQLLAAGEAVLASNMWNSSAGFLAGIFMQGGFVFISFVMLRTRGFGKATAWSGIISNGLDWLHLLVGLGFPALATILLSIGGVFYVAWFILLGRDLYRFRDGGAGAV